MKLPIACPAHKKIVQLIFGWLVIVLAVLATGCDNVASNVPELFSHEKMAVVVSRAWTVGEYKVCQSYDSGKEDTEPLLTCDSFGDGDGKRFKVSFHGPTYVEGDYYTQKTTFNWDCKKNNNDDLVFSCQRKAQDHSTHEGQAQTPTEHPDYELSQHTLSELPPIEPALPEPVEECAVRFWNKLIHEINGKSVEAACKENPNLQP